MGTRAQSAGDRMMTKLEIRLEAARDVCMYCGGRAPLYASKAVGPNEAGNYVHKSAPGRGLGERVRLCDASSIHSRIAAEA